MKIRNIIECLLLVFLAGLISLGLSSPVRAIDDFNLQITINGEDISGMETVVIEPDEDMRIDLAFDNGDKPVTIREMVIEVTFAGQVVLKKVEPLADFHMEPGEVRRERINVDFKEIVQPCGVTITTGIYHSRVSLKYDVGSGEAVWRQQKDVKIPGNPLTTPAGAAGAAVSVAAAAAIVGLVKSIAVPGIASGSVLSAGVSMKAMPGLYELAMDRLESTTRGRVVGNIVNSAKKRIIKRQCPVCETRLKHGHCYTCRKSAKEVTKEYTERIKDLVLQGGQLIAGKQVTTMKELCSELGISGKTATDVVATLKHSGLIKVKGIARKITGRAVTAGICSGLSAIIWITVGGFAVLSATVLISILIAAIVIPFAIGKSLQIKAKRDIRRSAN